MIDLYTSMKRVQIERGILQYRGKFFVQWYLGHFQTTFMKSLCENSKRSLVNLEAVVWRYSVEKVLLKTSQNSAENISSRVSFLIKLHMTYGLQVDFGKQIFHRHFRKCCRQKNGDSKFRLHL